ncbi:MAG: Ig-like domain-containing protein, partial [Gemmatimonadaceae bacterium]|nr:Ig-like domain-containing protein [Gemmatimonadaceae bacterium]
MMRLRGRTAARVGGALVVAALLLSCSEATVTSPRVAAVELTAPAREVRVGNTIAIAARLRDAQGGVVTSRAITWSSSAPAVATVSSTGVVSAVAPGVARIAASAFGTSATVALTVLPREVARLQVLPAALAVRVGSTATLQARTFDTDGELLTGRAVAWSSSSPTVATVTGEGVLTALAAGVTTITATSEGRTGQSAVTVTLAPVATVAIAPIVDTLPLGGTRTFQATLRDAGGTTLTGRSVSWRSSVDSIATVSSAGVVNALSPGTVTITAASEGRSAVATLVVLSRLASSVTLTPANATLIVGGTLTLQAQVTDASGNVLPGRPIDFTSTNAAVASVSSGGVITALAPGTTRIVATSEGRTGSASITVIPVPVASVQVAPATATLALGAGTQLTASARAANGAEL